MPQQTRQQALWRYTRRLTAGLLLAWLALSLGVPWFARALDQVHVAGFPLGYWLAAQGTLLGFLLIIVVHVRCMDRREAEYLARRDAEGSDPASDPGDRSKEAG
jgi:putative solute:sodium symporter small subunit